MMKRKEISDPTSCLNHAEEDEIVFVLLARDPAAPLAIRAWIQERLKLDKNDPYDDQISEASECIKEMEKWRHKNRPTK